MVDIDEGPTPIGGDKTVAYWWDADGLACASDRAVSAEIVEYMDGIEVRRTHWIQGAAPLDREPEVDVEDQDLIKGEWDLWCWNDGEVRLVETLEQLQQVFGSDDFRLQLGALMGTPAWVSAPEPLRTQANDYMVATRP